MAKVNLKAPWRLGDDVESRQEWDIDVNSDDWSSRFILGLLAVAFGLVAGMLFTAVNPLYAAAGIIGLLAAMAILMNTQLGLYSLIGVVFLLPFAVIPVPLGPVKLTFLDATLSALLVVWLARVLVKPGENLRIGRTGGLLLIFIFLTIVSFIAGTAYGISAETSRLFLKIINSFLLFFTITNCIRTRKQLDQLVSVLIVAGAIASAIGLALYFLPAATSTRLLNSLRVLGYPTGSVLRYIADTDTLRAISTSIDPNVLGAVLMIVSVLGVNQLLSTSPVLKRSWLVPLVGVTLACLLLTYSRSSWVGLIVAVVFLATIRYRRLWLVFGLLAVAVILGTMPGETAFVGHLQSGLMAQDKAAAMRLGEYKDALRLISAYPWFGVGFGQAPSVDVYIGVSNIYLLLAEETGLIGLGSFLLVIGYTLVTSLRQLLVAGIFRVSVRLSDSSSTHVHLLGFVAALLAALTTGMFDHHFMNLRFPHVVAVFWLVVGLIAVTKRFVEEGDQVGR